MILLVTAFIFTILILIYCLLDDFVFRKINNKEIKKDLNRVSLEVKKERRKKCRKQ